MRPRIGVVGHEPPAPAHPRSNNVALERSIDFSYGNGVLIAGMMWFSCHEGFGGEGHHGIITFTAHGSSGRFRAGNVVGLGVMSMAGIGVGITGTGLWLAALVGGLGGAFALVPQLLASSSGDYPGGQYQQVGTLLPPVFGGIVAISCVFWCSTSPRTRCPRRSCSACPRCRHA